MDTPRRLWITAALAGVVSGLPSTVAALLRGDDVLAATRAAGTLVPGRRRRPGVAAGIAAHAVLTLWWTAVLTAWVRRVRGGVVAGALGGAAIAALDLGVVARRHPAIRDLPQLPQWADHLAFGAVVGAAASSGRSGRSARSQRHNNPPERRFPGRLVACRCTTCRSGRSPVRPHRWPTTRGRRSSW